MLHTSLSLALLASGAEAPAPLQLSDLMPAEAMVVVEIGDIGGALATPAEERGDWLRLLMDERVTAPLVELTDLADDQPEVLDALGAAARATRGGAAAYDAVDGGYVLVALDVDEGFEETVDKLLESTGMLLHEHEHNGTWGVMDTEDEAAASLGIFTIADKGRAYMCVGEPGLVSEPLFSLMKRADAPEERELWWQGADRGGVDALVGVHLDLSSLPMPVELELLFQNFADSAYIGMEMGSGHDGGMVFSANLVGGEISDAFADCFAGEADMGLLLAAPKGVRSAQAMNFDPIGFLDAIAALVDAMEPGAGAADMIDAGLESASSFLGLDVEEDLLGNLTGDVFAFQWLDDVEAYVAFTENETDPDLASDAAVDGFVDAFPVIGFGLADEEPFIELLETIGPLAASVGGELMDEDDSVTLRIAPEDAPFEAFLRVGGGYLTVSMDAGRMEAVIERLGRELFDGMVDETTFSKAKESVGGAGVAVIDPTLFTEIITATTAMQDVPEGELAIVEDVLDAVEEHIGGICLSEGWMNAKSIGGRFLTR